MEKVASAKPGAKPKLIKVKKSTDDRIRDLKKALGITTSWSKLQYNVQRLQTA